MKNEILSVNNCFQNNNCVTLYECFSFYQKTEFFSGKNQNYCDVCEQLTDSLNACRILISPNVLVLILNRGKNNVYDVKLDFYERIHITDFVLEKDSPYLIYDLYGVITILGESGLYSNFVASFISIIDNNWYIYNVSIASLINNLKKEVFDLELHIYYFIKKLEIIIMKI